MKILVVSDTHGRTDNYLKVLRKQKPLDLVVHCGDVEGKESTLARESDCPIHIVAGNNDFFSGFPRELELQLGEYKVWVTHGHRYYVNAGNQTLKEGARARGVDLVMYGHTHRPLIDMSDKGLVALNPGSLSYPRQEGHRPSYMIMEIDPHGEAHYTVAYL